MATTIGAESEGARDNRGSRPSSWAIAAGLLALATLFVVSGGSFLLPLLALGLVGPIFFSYRLESDSYLRWMVRIALIALIYQVSQLQNDDARNVPLAIGSASLRSLFGQLYGAEMVVQAWRRRPVGSSQSTLAVTLFSGLVYLTACNTFDTRLIVVVTPLYMLFVVFALRDWRSRISIRRGDSHPMSSRQQTMTKTLRIIVVLFALGMGATSQKLVLTYKDNLNDLGTRFLQDRQFLESLGMSGQPQLGSTFGLRGSPTRILRIKNLTGDAHMRGATFDTYTLGGRWGAPLSRIEYKASTSEDLPPVHPLYGTTMPRSRDDMTITRLTNMPLLFAPVNVITLTTGDSQDKSDTVEWAPKSGGILRNRSRAPFDYIVSVTSDTIPYQGPLCQPILRDVQERARYLQVPPTTENGKAVPDALYMQTLAQHITAKADTVPKKIAAITQYLLTHHHYSLSTKIGPGDPVASFLREKKDAHCEFFAASSTLLLRYAGVPARYATGYLAHEAGSAPNETIVRQRDAHAWTEAWVDGAGWVSVDATPGDGRPDDMKQDPISPWQRLNEWFQDRVQAIKDKLADVPPAVLNAIVILAALLPLGLYGWFALVRSRRKRESNQGQNFTYAAAQAEIAELTARFETAFRRAGYPFMPERTYSEQLVPPTPTSLIETGRHFARVYDAARFGGHIDNETLPLLARLVDEIEREAATEKKKP